MQKANQQGSGVLATISGGFILLLGAGAVVGQLQQSLDVIFGVTPKPDVAWWAFLRARFFSYAMLLAIGFLLLISLIVTTVLSAISKYFGHLLPGLATIWPAGCVRHAAVRIDLQNFARRSDRLERCPARSGSDLAPV